MSAMSLSPSHAPRVLKAKTRRGACHMLHEDSPWWSCGWPSKRGWVYSVHVTVNIELNGSEFWTKRVGCLLSVGQKLIPTPAAIDSFLGVKRQTRCQSRRAVIINVMSRVLKRRGLWLKLVYTTGFPALWSRQFLWPFRPHKCNHNSLEWW
jgi:hypothetical protein